MTVLSKCRADDSACRTIADNTCAFPKNLFGCGNHVVAGDVKFISDDIKIECEVGSSRLVISLACQCIGTPCHICSRPPRKVWDAEHACIQPLSSRILCKQAAYNNRHLTGMLVSLGRFGCCSHGQRFQHALRYVLWVHLVCRQPCCSHTCSHTCSG